MFIYLFIYLFVVEARAGVNGVLVWAVVNGVWYYNIMNPMMISKLYGDFSQVLTAVPTYLYLAPGRKIIISWWSVSQIYFKHQDAIWNAHPVIVVAKIRPMWLPIIVPIKFATMSLLWIRFPVLLFTHYVTLDDFLAIVWPCLSLMKKSGDDT